MNALEGVVVVDFGQYLAGPFGPMVLADLGADVIKVEPVRGDGMRFVPQPFSGCQRGKRDLALDLKSPHGHRIALELVERADIVHHNMTLGTAARLGILPTTLHEKMKRLGLLQRQRVPSGPIVSAAVAAAGRDGARGTA